MRGRTIKRVSSGSAGRDESREAIQGLMTMRSFVKAGFFWQFAGGFALGAVALLVFQPASATRTLATNIATATHLAR
jgi:hypothetical protein